MEKEVLEKITLPGGVKLAILKKEDLKFLEKNARYMGSEMYRNLVKNISSDGYLSSVPFCWKDGDTYHILSGNHRIKAAIDAGIEEFLVLYTDEPLSRSRQIAIQLSHNAIEGKDDPEALRSLWAEIADISDQMYSGISSADIGDLPKVSLEALSPIGMDTAIVSIIFFPEEAERFEAALDRIGSVAGQKHAAADPAFAKFIAALDNIKAAYDIKNSAMAIAILLDIFERHVEDIQEGYALWEEPDKRRVPIKSVLGTDKISVGLAQKLKMVIERVHKKDKDADVMETLIGGYLESRS